MKKYIEIWFRIHVSTSVRVHEKILNKFFENKLVAQNLSQSNPFFFGGRTTTGRNLHLEQKTRKILKKYIKTKWV